MAASQVSSGCAGRSSRFLGADLVAAHCPHLISSSRRPALSRTAYEVQQQQQRALATSPSPEDRSNEQTSKRRRVDDASAQQQAASDSKSTPNPNRRVTRSATGAVPHRSSGSPSRKRGGSGEAEAIVLDDESEEEWKPEGSGTSSDRSKRPTRNPGNGSASPAVNGDGRALKDVQGEWRDVRH